MLNTLKQTTKEWTNKCIKSIAIAGTALLILLKPGISKGNDAVKSEINDILSKYPTKNIVIQESPNTNEKTYELEQTKAPTNAFAFAKQNVSKYYPDMKDHLDTLLNHFRDQEQKDSTIALLNKMIEKISDPEQKTGAIIYALEGVFRGKQPFSLKYDSKITDETFKHIEQFDIEYNARFNRYYERLIIKSEKLKKTLLENQEKIEKSKKEFEEMMNKFSPEDIRNIPWMKERIVEIQKMYSDNKFKIPKHMQLLFDAVK